MSKRPQQATIPQPAENMKSLLAVSLATKELLETLAGQRRSMLDAAVTWQDLVDLGLITADRVPKP